jgi:hypothetical protein
MKDIDRQYAEVTLANASDDTDCVMASTPFKLFSSIELLVGGKSIFTIRDKDLLEAYLFNHDLHEMTRREASTAVDPATFAVDTGYGTIAYGESRTWRIPFNLILDQAGIPRCLIKQKVQVRFNSQNLSNLLASGSAADLTCTNFRLFVRELDANEGKLNELAKKSLDWRVVIPKHDEGDLALTSGSTHKYKCTNFDEGDLY